ncbi:MAG: BF3164 family lipoprotein [Candidatus Altarchaeum sp.]|nr:BF3164 family lipoprotein [Candidatus Altarchaeum sp.]
MRKPLLSITILISLTFLLKISCNYTPKPEVHYLVQETAVKYFGADSLPFFSRPQKIKITNDKIFVLDQKHHRILIFDHNFNHIKQIGRKGRGPGEFILPASFQVFKDLVYVADAANYRFDIISTDGKYIRSFRPQYPIFQDLTFCIDSRGYLFINHPMSENLITVYNELGEIVNGIGKLVDEKDPRFKITINYAHIEIDEYDNIYVSFLMLPILRKYDKTGKLLWEKDLTNYTEIREMSDFFINKRETKPDQKYNVFSLSKDVYYKSPYLYILFQGVIPYGNTVYAFNENGKVNKIMRISKGNIPIDSISNYGKLAVDNKGHIYLSDKTDYQVVRFKLEN